jgi:hypothetical protein
MLPLRRPGLAHLGLLLRAHSGCRRTPGLSNPTRGPLRNTSCLANAQHSHRKRMPHGLCLQVEAITASLQCGKGSGTQWAADANRKMAHICTRGRRRRSCACDSPTRGVEAADACMQAADASADGCITASADDFAGARRLRAPTRARSRSRKGDRDRLAADPRSRSCSRCGAMALRGDMDLPGRMDRCNLGDADGSRAPPPWR